VPDYRDCRLREASSALDSFAELVRQLKVIRAAPKPYLRRLTRQTAASRRKLRKLLAGGGDRQLERTEIALQRLRGLVLGGPLDEATRVALLEDIHCKLIPNEPKKCSIL
jgi:hypothetical protein